VYSAFGEAVRLSPSDECKKLMKSVNLIPNADFVGNRPPKPVDAKAIRKFSQRRPLIDIRDGDTPRGAEEVVEESRRQAILAEKERSLSRASDEAAASAAIELYQ
jgi:hypothetical protein